MKQRIIGIFFSVLLIFAGSCKKNDNNNPTPANKAILSVNLKSPYLEAAQVDSAFAIWKTSASEKRFKMLVRNDSLILQMSTFDEGAGELTLHIFSNKKYDNQYYGQWVGRRTMSWQHTQSVNYNGPASFFDTAWFPRIELVDGIGHKAIIALRPDDPYFLVRDPGHAINKLAIERAYWYTIGGVQLAGVAVWECYTGCTDLPNDEYFKVLPSRIGNRPWNHISINVVFQIDPVGGGYILSLEHEP